ncbi:MAG TPA: ABC transporter ATP-binding protein [Candidatus Cybelea sp.]|nr:ABC transporter ATP-binding protein [Candidatus Cybelea sp.]
MTAMIEIAHLSKRFGPLVAVDDVSFSVAKGEVLGFLGPNGAGKSTTMKMLTGFLTPSSGAVKVAGFDVVDDALAAKRQIGYLPEGAPAYPDMTPAGFLDFIAEVRGLKGTERKAAIERVTSHVHLGPVMDQPIETLSKGFKRRVGLAQAILHDPPVLVLDEPTDGLDPNQKHEVRELIRRMAPEKAIVISTHILEEVEAVCTRAVVIARGRLIAEGHPLEIGWRLGDYQAEPGKLDAVFRFITASAEPRSVA